MSNKIINENLEQIIARTFGNYSKYIIQDRALPDVRDGLKPVQRRILYAMADLKIFHNSQYKKSARVVGEVIGKYHPHGDSSVYEAAVRMAQDWKMNYPLIEMHGNKGSVDGDSAAAMRYTEIRLSKLSEYLINDIKKDTVNFINNFDDNEVEPVIFPAKFPNLLLNGSVGIAAGYSTNIPPHNFMEIVDATILRIKNQKSTVEDILEIVKGPDFPTYGVIVDNSELKDIYTKGRGKIKVRADVEVNKNEIIIHSIPYEVNKQDLVKSINELMFNNKIPGVKSAVDQTDRTGMRIVITCASASEVEKILHYLYKTTELQKNYNFNMVAISHNKPKQMGILEILDSYIHHQIEVYTRQFNFDLAKAKSRLEIVDGLIKVVDVIDEVIKEIRSSKNKSDSKSRLISRFGFTDTQAEAIVTLRLYRLSSTDINMLITERAELDKTVSNIEELLSSKTKLRNHIAKNMTEMKSMFDWERKTKIDTSQKTIEVTADDLIKEEMVHIYVSRKGYIKKLSHKAFNAFKDEDVNKSYEIQSDDILIAHSEEPVSNLHNLFLFTSKGRFIVIPIHKLKSSKWKEAGQNVNVFDHLTKDEEIIEMTISNSYDIDYSVTSVSSNGFIKKSDFASLENSRKSKFMTYAKVTDDNFITSVSIINNTMDTGVVIVTRDGYSLRYNTSLIPNIGLKSKGVIAIKLSAGDKVAGMVTYYTENRDKNQIGVISENGKYKRVYVRDLQVDENRNKKGKLIARQIKTNPNHILQIFMLNKQSDTMHILDSNNKWHIEKCNSIDISKQDSSMSKLIDSEIIYAHKNEVLHLKSATSVKKSKPANTDKPNEVKLDMSEENISAKRIEIDTDTKPVQNSLEMTIESEVVEIEKPKKTKKQTQVEKSKQITLEFDIEDLIDDI